jgi:hypothetical protein
MDSMFIRLRVDAVQANIASASVIPTVAKEHVKERLSTLQSKGYRRRKIKRMKR